MFTIDSFVPYQPYGVSNGGSLAPSGGHRPPSRHWRHIFARELSRWGTTRRSRLAPSASSVVGPGRRSRGEAVANRCYRVTVFLLRWIGPNHAQPHATGNPAANTRRLIVLSFVSHKSFRRAEREGPETRTSPARRKEPLRNHRGHRMVVVAAQPALFSPLVQASAPRTVRGPKTSATLGKPLSREFLFYRSPASLDAVGQWPVCRAGASPTEDPCN